MDAAGADAVSSVGLATSAEVSLLLILGPAAWPGIIEHVLTTFGLQVLGEQRKREAAITCVLRTHGDFIYGITARPV